MPPSLDTCIARLSCAVAEIAEQAGDLVSYRTGVLELLARELGCDFGSIQNTCSETTLYHYPVPLSIADMARYMAEFTAAELARLAVGRALVAEEVTSSERRRELAMWRDLLTPAGVTSLVTAVWPDRVGFVGYHLTRCGPVRGFDDGEKQQLSALKPLLALAERLHTGPVEDDARLASWAQGVGLTRAEQRIAQLTVRGLTNREIAALLACSPHTVRNHLAATFKKVGVSTRAELVFASYTDAGAASRANSGSLLAEIRRHAQTAAR